jgi:hypothetical protein
MRYSIALGLALMVASPAAARPDPDLGRVVQNNVHAQLVDPDPQYARILIEGGTGRLGARAWQRYQSDNVKALRPLSGTSDLGRATGSGNNGGSSGGNNSSGSGSN